MDRALVKDLEEDGPARDHRVDDSDDDNCGKDHGRGGLGVLLDQRSIGGSGGEERSCASKEYICVSGLSLVDSVYLESAQVRTDRCGSRRWLR